MGYLARLTRCGWNEPNKIPGFEPSKIPSEFRVRWHWVSSLWSLTNPLREIYTRCEVRSSGIEAGFVHLLAALASTINLGLFELFLLPCMSHWINCYLILFGNDFYFVQKSYQTPLDQCYWNRAHQFSCRPDVSCAKRWRWRFLSGQVRPVDGSSSLVTPKKRSLWTFHKVACHCCNAFRLKATGGSKTQTSKMVLERWLAFDPEVVYK